MLFVLGLKEDITPQKMGIFDQFRNRVDRRYAGIGGSENSEPVGTVALAALVCLYTTSCSQTATDGEKHELVGASFPALDVTPLVNGPAPLALEDVAGQVALINFWGPWYVPLVGASFPGLDVAPLANNLAQLTLEDVAGQVVLINFWGPWCMPCRMLGPTIESLAGEYGDRAKIGKVDVDTNQQLAKQYAIQSIPTTLLFVDGQVVERFVGVASKDDLKRAIDQSLGTVAA